MADSDYKVWERNPGVEQRTYDRVTGKLPEMESAKQLRTLIAEVYAPGMKILDVGCAAGHYYNSLSSIDDALDYTGVDATDDYIDFATNHFRGESKAIFETADIYGLPPNYNSAFDVVFCCNVLLHLPSIEAPLKNLISASKKYVFIRTLVGTNSHLSKFLYSDRRDDLGEPTDFVYQNTYTREWITKIVLGHCDAQVEFIADEFDVRQINREFSEFQGAQSGVTRVENGVQIAGSKVFEWEWIRITKGPSH